MITNGVFGLDFGGLDLMGNDKTGPYWFEALADETDFGDPVPVIKAIESFLMDGAIESTESYDNREMTLKVAVCGEDSPGLALGEQALMGQVAKRNVLTFTPPNIITGSGTPSVFDVVNSSLSYTFDDIGDLRLERIYKITIKALPGARSDTLTTVTSPAPPNTTPAVTVIDNCNTLTGWSIVSGGAGTASVASGVVKASYTRTSGGSYYEAVTLGLTRSGLSVSMTGTPYLRLQMVNAPTAPTFQINGTPATIAARNGDVFWLNAPATVTSVTASVRVNVIPGSTTTFQITDLAKTDMTQDQSGQKQLFRQFAVGGSVRTQGSLTIADPTAALGSVLVYTSQNNQAAQPPLRVLRTAGSTETTDATAVSGKNSDLSTLHTFDIPANQVPSGGYQLYARVQHASAGTYAIAWAGRGRVGTTNDTGQSGTLSTGIPAATWTIVPVAKLTLPTRQMGSAGLVRIELSGPAGLLLDEAWLFGTDDGDLTWVECGTAAPSAGGSSNRLWLDPASLTSPVSQVWRGTAADRSDAVHPTTSIQSFAEHQCTPPSMNVFTVTSNSVAASVTLSLFARFHTHVA